MDNVFKIYVRAAEATKDTHNRGVYFERGAIAAEEADNPEKAAQFYRKLLDTLLEDRFLIDAPHLIKIAKKVGDNDRLITAYERGGQHQEAYKLAIVEGYIERAIEISLKVLAPEKLSKMAQFALDNGHADMAVQIYEHAGLDKEAARTANQHGNPQKALEICEQKINTDYICADFRDSEYFDIAMDAASKIGDDERRTSIGHQAMERFSVLGKFDISAKFADKLGYTGLASTYQSLASLPKV